MKHSKIAFNVLIIYVEDLDASKLFYKRLGFKEKGIGDTEDYLYAQVAPPGNGDLIVELREPFTDVKPGTVSMGFTVDNPEGAGIHNAVEDLLLRGFNFTNLTPRMFYIGLLGSSVELEDPQGAKIEILTDPYEY